MSNKIDKSSSATIATTKEIKIVKMLADGNGVKEVLRVTGLPAGTLAYILAMIRVKFRCKNTNHLIAYFLRNKIID